MPARNNPVDDKVRGARKRHGDRAALWGLLVSLYASGRDAEAEQLRDELRRSRDAESVLSQGLLLPDVAGGLGDGIVGWVALRYHAAEQSGDQEAIRHVEDVLPRAAYPITEWQQRARPRPNLFDMSVDEAYEAAKEFLGSKEKRPVKQGTVVFRFDDGWTVQDLDTKALLVDEGNHQHICVGQEKQGYPQAVENGEIKVYSLRDPSGHPHVTMTWSEYDKIYEAASAFNGTVISRDIRRRCADFGRSLGMTNAELLLKELEIGRGLDLSGSDLSDVVLDYAVLDGANLSDANLASADLSGVSMKGANLRGANLYYTNMTGANLCGANLHDANLTEASLVRAVYDGKTVWPDDFDPTEAGAKKRQ